MGSDVEAEIHHIAISDDADLINAREAESRRLSRFEPIGHTQGPFELRNAVKSPGMPVALDLRRTKN